MKHDEAIAILAILKTAYPNFYKGMDSEEIDDAISLWATMFESDNVRVVTEAVKAFIATDIKGFPPAVGQIKEKIALITQPKQFTELEAWGIVLKGIQNASYRAQESFDNFPPLIQKLVGSPGQLREWAITENLNIEVVSSNFMRSYKARVAQEKERSMLPESTRQMISGLADKMALTEGEG